MTAYLETSALLAWLLGEPMGEQARLAIDGADQIVTSVLTLTECRRSLVRAEQSGVVTAAQRQRLLGLLARVERAWAKMDVSLEIRARAEAPFPIEPVRTLDALHLATALLVARVFPDVDVLSFDQRINDNARALGLSPALA